VQGFPASVPPSWQRKYIVLGEYKSNSNMANIEFKVWRELFLALTKRLKQVQQELVS
jgi:hypothetical protein